MARKALPHRHLMDEQVTWRSGRENFHCNCKSPPFSFIDVREISHPDASVKIDFKTKNPLSIISRIRYEERVAYRVIVQFGKLMSCPLLVLNLLNASIPLSMNSRSRVSLPLSDEFVLRLHPLPFPLPSSSVTAEAVEVAPRSLPFFLRLSFDVQDIQLMLL